MAKPILYDDGANPVQLGDEVEFCAGLLLLFKKYQGRVVYVPGISPLNGDMEFDGLQWIAIEVPGKMLVRMLVDPQTHRLVHKTLLLRRNPSEHVTMPPSLEAESDN